MKSNLVILICLISFYGTSQDMDSITLLNGRTYFGTHTRIENNFILTDVTDKKGDTYTLNLEMNRVFSNYSKGVENAFYTQDTLQGDYLSLEETRNVTWGSRDARITSKPIAVFLSSVALSYGASLYDTYFTQKSLDALTDPGFPAPELNVGFFGAKPSIMHLMIPTAITLVWALPSFKVKPHQIIQPGMSGNAYYYRGYNRIAKQKRMFSALAGGFLGTSLGLISYGIFRIN